MIDLKEKELANAIKANGRFFLINTDFRVWMEFPERIRLLKDGDFSGYIGLFKKSVPFLNDEVMESLGRFYHVPKEVPRSDGGNKEKVLDYDIDADYIYAAFMQTYGIDLLEEDMHWHKFKALLSALPADTMISEIMKCRDYEGNSKDLEYKERMKLKNMWALPQEITEEEKAAMEEFEELFG